MAFKKEIIVLSGGKHKGLVKLRSESIGSDRMSGICSLDFKPSTATLYIIGEEIAEIALNGSETTFLIADYGKTPLSCVVLSDAPLMFGSNGNLSRSMVMSRVEKHVKDKLRVQSQMQITEEKLQNKIAAYSCDSMEEKCFTAEDNLESIVSADGDEKSQGIVDIREEEYPIDIAQVNEDETNVEIRDIPNRKKSVRESVGRPSDWVKYDGNNFYMAVKPQLDEMFVCYPSEEQLNEGVPNSQWVRIDTPDGYYVVGLLFDDKAPAYICYGVPARQGERPPQEIASMCVWLPLEGDEGYWVIYQSAYTGEVIK